MVQVRRVSHNFGTHWALKDVSLSLEKGGFLFLTGPSGAGKTTLLRLLYGSLPLVRGAAEVAGFDLKTLKPRQVPHLRRQVSVVFQDFKILPDRTVAENVALPLEVRGERQSVIVRRVNAVLRSLNLSNRGQSLCGSLSGGEQQRVAIARAIVVNPKLLLADEPTGNLDLDLALHLMDVFKQFNTFGTTIILATHNREIVRSVPAARRLELADGQVVGSWEPRGASRDCGGSLQDQACGGGE
ncbi:cell division ATP-binding protein FtsE [Desulfobaculum xiamenense]|nr:cell division ATP-binding protein FtsE [Desulfobaculum xiamenense]